MSSIHYHTNRRISHSYPGIYSMLLKIFFTFLAFCFAFRGAYFANLLSVINQVKIVHPLLKRLPRYLICTYVILTFPIYRSHLDLFLKADNTIRIGPSGTWLATFLCFACTQYVLKDLSFPSQPTSVCVQGISSVYL